MALTPAGNKVIWNEFERVELDDMVAAGDLPLRALAQSLGILRGKAGDHGAPFDSTGQNGLMSRLIYDGSDSTNVTFSTFQVGFCDESNGPDDEGRTQWFALFSYDLTTSFQVGRSTASLDFTGYDGLQPFVWAHRYVAEADYEPRREWDEVSELEEGVNLNTRSREYVRLGLSDISDPHKPPSAKGDWVKIARAISVSVPGSVVLAPRYGLSKYDAVYEASATSLANGVAAKYWDSDRNTDGPGLADAITTIFAVLSKLRDGRWQFNPDTYNLADASVAGLRGWAHQVDDPTAVGLTQLEELQNLPDNVTRILRGRDTRGGYLGRVTCSAGGAFTYDNKYIQIVASGPFNTDGTAGTSGAWYLVEVNMGLIFLSPSEFTLGEVGDPILPYTYDTVRIQSVVVTPFHDSNAWAVEDKWADAAVGRVIDIAPQHLPPYTIGPGGEYKVKVRFRRPSTGLAIAPDNGWCMTFFGEIVPPA